MAEPVPSESEALVATAWTESHRAGVRRYLRMLGCSADEADELCQETFVRLLGAPFEEQGPRATWRFLHRAARWEFLRWRRQQGRRPEVEWTEAVDRHYGAWTANDGGELWLDTLRSCLTELTPRARSAVRLSYVDGLSRREIAKALNMKENGVKTLLQRARHTLRHCIESKDRGHLGEERLP